MTTSTLLRAALPVPLCLAAILFASQITRADILVGDHLDGGVFRINQITGAPVGGQPFAEGVSGAQGEAVSFGPDGNLYATYALPNGNTEVRRYNPYTGAEIAGGPFIAPGAGGLHYAGDMRWGPDGNLYVANFGDFVPDGMGGQAQIPGGTVLKYNADGVYQSSIDLGFFTSPSGIAIDRASGDMYVTNWYSNELMKSNIYSSAAPVSIYSGPLLDNPSGISIGPDGNLYIANMSALTTGGTGNVQSFNTSGTPINTLATMPSQSYPAGVIFTNEGKMVVSSLSYGALYSYNTQTLGWDYFADVTGGNPGSVNPALMALSPISGDANADGIVNIADLTIVADKWQTGGPTGDVNGDGKVDIADIAAIANNWQATTYNTGGGGSITAVPEPATFGLACLAIACGALSWARKRRVAKN